MNAEIHTCDTSKALSQMFGRPPVYDAIFSCLTPVGLIRMALVSRAVHSAIKEFKRRAYNINKRLAYYFDDPLSFRSLMARTHMVISGSFALQFFDRSFYPNSDLDLYIRPDTSIEVVGSYLLNEGYLFKPTPWQSSHYASEIRRTLFSSTPPRKFSYRHITTTGEANILYSLKSVCAVYSFERAVGDAEGDVRKVQVVVARSSLVETILTFRSSELFTMWRYYVGPTDDASQLAL